MRGAWYLLLTIRVSGCLEGAPSLLDEVCPLSANHRVHEGVPGDDFVRGHLMALKCQEHLREGLGNFCIPLDFRQCDVVIRCPLMADIDTVVTTVWPKFEWKFREDFDDCVEVLERTFPECLEGGLREVTIVEGC